MPDPAPRIAARAPSATPARTVPWLDRSGRALVWVRVDAPPGFAHAALNGSEGVVVAHAALYPVVLLLSGPEAGRERGVRPDHLAPTPAAPGS